MRAQGRAPPGRDDGGAGGAQVGVRSIDVASTDRAGFRARMWYPTSGGVPQTINANAVRAVAAPRAWPGSQHFSFLFLCRPNAAEFLEPDEAFVCQEKSGRTREQIHAEALEPIASFLRDRSILATPR